MTTEHMHHEHSDADEAIVGNVSVPASIVETGALDAAPAEEAEISATAPSSEPVVSSDIPPELQEQAPVALVEEAATSQLAEVKVEADSVSIEQGHEQHPQETVSPESAIVTPDAGAHAEFTAAQTDGQPIAEAVVDEAHQDFPFSSSEEMPFVASNNEEIRPFTSFIEEFRQAEEQARLNTALQESPTETFTLFTSVDEQERLRSASYEVSAESSFVETVNMQDSEQVASPETATAAAVSPTATIEETESETAANASPAPSFTRPAVSPLLRPASRMRSSRHTTRHQRPEIATEPELPTQPVTATPASSVEPRSENETQPATKVEAPKPARRYRFDRPATAPNGIMGTAQSAATLPTSPIARTESLASEALIETAAKAPAGPISSIGSLTSEQQALKPFADVELPGTVEDIRSSAITTRENGRRANGQDHSKEQTLPIASSLTDATVSASEAAAAVEKIAPEDLPPLEYSELQKNTRKRRRHRTTASNGSTAPTSAAALQPAIPATPLAPLVPIAPIAPIVPIAPSEAPAAQAPAAQAPMGNPTTLNAPYSIVSGYTVSQMNQGNENTGPFMGPEPSPARGSLITRESRSIQRPPIASSSYPARSSEALPSSASFNHFTNMMVQALQAQTDRMVAEMRRANQVPTSVSVTLPPFPSTERVGVFVDVANLLYSARTLRISVDFGKLLDFLRGNRRLVRAHAYCPTSPQAGDEQMFLQAVKGLGYRITTKNYKTFSSGAKKADLDLDLCMDVVRIVDGGAVDCIVLVSGDSDFMPMLDYCSDHGVRVEVAAFDEAMSATLRQSCDLFINLSMLEEIRS